jgi:leucyl aminopeptidase
MIRTISRATSRLTGKEEVVVLALFRGERQLIGPSKKLDVLCHSRLSHYLETKRFSCDLGETLIFALDLPKAPEYVLLVGLGEKKRITAEKAANAGGSASRLLKKRHIKTCHVLVGEDLLLGDDSKNASKSDLFHPFLKGFLLAQYNYTLASKPDGDKGPRKLVLMSDDRARVSAAIHDVRIVAEHTGLVRDLVNSPANILTPSKMAEEAGALAKSCGFHCRTMGPREIEKLGMGAVTSVARGSREEPRLITLHHNRGKSSPAKICLVGKGVTFDSGGISIKPWMDMNEMKGDMAGGAVVMSVIAAAAKRRIPLEIIGIIPCVENLPDGTAFRPGDVLTTYSGKTIEVLSTDAEGRLILADALAYAREFKADLILDLATLTGAVLIALGTRFAAAFGNHQGYIDDLIEAGRVTGELVWQLPLDDLFADMVKGEISDYKNYSGRNASSITAAALLGEFVGDIPWIHLDIAGTFWSDGSKTSYHTKGGTGYGVDLILRFLEGIASRKKPA